MSDAISLNILESIPALHLAGGMESQQQKQDRQGRRGSGGGTGADAVELSPEAEKQVQKLQERDREVRAHEQAHIAAGGQHVSGGASFSYQTGPDGRQYAIGGSVQIECSAVPGDPDATEEKARAVRRAALAPANPSSTDQNVAAKAAAMESKARSDKVEQERESGQDGSEGASTVASFDSPGGLRRSAAGAYAWLASPVHGVSWQSSAGNGNRPASVIPSQPWPGQERAAAIYASVRDSALPQTQLAPWGSGISLAV